MKMLGFATDITSVENINGLIAKVCDKFDWSISCSMEQVSTSGFLLWNSQKPTDVVQTHS